MLKLKLFLLIVFLLSFPVQAEDNALLIPLMTFANQGELTNPYNLSLTPDGNILVVDQKNLLQKFTPAGVKVDWKPTIPEEFYPCKFASVAVDKDGKIYLAHKTKGILVLSPEGKLLQHIQNDKFSWLDAITYHPLTNQFYLADNSQIYLLTPTGEVLSTFADALLWQPCGITVTPAGLIYVADTNHHEIKIFDFTGKMRWKWGEKGQFNSPFGIAHDKNGRIYVTDCGPSKEDSGSLIVFTDSGIPLYTYQFTNAAKPVFPTGILISNDLLYITDTLNNLIHVFKITDIAP